MTQQAVLIELLNRLGANQGAAVLVNEEELSQWPEDAVTAMKTQGLLAKTRPASSAICPGCEHQCVMPVYVFPAKDDMLARAFIVCDKRSDTSRVSVLFEKLNQWQCQTDSLCRFIATCLGLRHSNQHEETPGLWNIGIAAGKKIAKCYP